MNKDFNKDKIIVIDDKDVVFNYYQSDHSFRKKMIDKINRFVNNVDSDTIDISGIDYSRFHLDFIDALNDDLNTPEALGIFFDFINTINKYIDRKFYFISAVLFLGIVLPFLFIDCPFRNLISITIFLYSIRFIESKNLLIYSLLSILALGFHTTSIIMIPVYFIINRKINNYIFIVLYTLSFIFFFFPEVVFIILMKLFSAHLYF